MRKYNLNIISEEPIPLDSISKDIVVDISQNRLELDFTQKLGFRIAGWLIVIIGIILILSSLNDFPKYFFVNCSILFLGFLFLFLSKKLKNKSWILNRHDQTISIPYNHKNTQDIRPIKELKSGYYIQTGGKYATVPIVVPVVWHKSRIALKNQSPLTTWDGNEKPKSDFARTWSYYLWYLDKNRPLPPGDLLDAFREEDFNRRKAEGFPPPLICSSIPTPEATPEQQAERDKYWKDEYHMIHLERYRNPESVCHLRGQGMRAIKMEKDSYIVSEANNPDNWEKVSYPENDNFRYLGTAFAMRYEFEDGAIAYSMINAKTEEVYTPPKGKKYKKEIIR